MIEQPYGQYEILFRPRVRDKEPDPARRDPQFSVHARHLNPHDARVVQATFEAAAVAYAEDLHVAPDDGDEVSLIVRDLETDPRTH